MSVFRWGEGKEATERKLREEKLTETRANSLYHLFFKKQKTKRLSPVKEGNQFFGFW